MARTVKAVRWTEERTLAVGGGGGPRSGPRAGSDCRGPVRASAALICTSTGVSCERGRGSCPGTSWPAPWRQWGPASATSARVIWWASSRC